MKKRFMLVAVLLGSLALASCVDDKESDSVTALRNAMTEQIKSKTTLNNVAAEVDKMKAEAEVAYKQALAAQVAVDTESAKQELALAQATFDAAVEAANAKLQKELQSYLSTAATTANSTLASLQYNYATALEDLQNLKTEKLRAEANIATLEKNVEVAQADAKAQVYIYRQQLAATEAKIAVLQDPAYTNIDNVELYAKWEAASKKAELARNELRSNQGVALKASSDTLKLAVDALEEVMDVVGELNSLVWVVEYSWDREPENIYYTDIYGSSIAPAYRTYSDFRINETRKYWAEKNLSDNVANALDVLGKSTDAKDKTASDGVTLTAYAQLAAAKAMPETNDTEKDAKALAIATATDRLARCQKDYDEAVAAQKAFADALAAIDLDVINQLIAAVDAAEEARDEAKAAFDEANEAAVKLEAECDILESLYYNATNIEEQLANLESKKVLYQKEISYYENMATEDAEISLAEGKQLILDLEAKIAVQEKVVEVAKAALETFLEGSEKEYTPVEG